MDIQTANPHDIGERIEKSYPESYKRLYPHVNQMVNEMSDDAMYNITDEDIDGMAVEAMARGGMNGAPLHNKDVAKVIVARELHDRHRRRGRRGRHWRNGMRFPLWPFLFLDSHGGYHDGYHGGFHDHDFDGYRDYDDFRDGYRHWY
jgi:hypothetical protein